MQTSPASRQLIGERSARGSGRQPSAAFAWHLGHLDTLKTVQAMPLVAPPAPDQAQWGLKDYSASSKGLLVSQNLIFNCMHSSRARSDGSCFNSQTDVDFLPPRFTVPALSLQDTPFPPAGPRGQGVESPVLSGKDPEEAINSLESLFSNYACHGSLI